MKERVVTDVPKTGRSGEEWEEGEEDRGEREETRPRATN